MSNGGGMGEAEQAYLDLKKKKKTPPNYHCSICEGVYFHLSVP